MSHEVSDGLLFSAGVMYRRKNHQTRAVVVSVDERDAILDKCHRGEIVDDVDGEQKNDDTPGTKQDDENAIKDGENHEESGDKQHCDFDTTVAAVKSRYFWKGIRMNVTKWVKNYVHPLDSA